MKETYWIAMALILGPFLLVQGYNAAVWDAQFNEQTKIDLIMVSFSLVAIFISVLLARINARSSLKFAVIALLFTTVLLATYQSQKDEIHLDLIEWTFHLQLAIVAFAILAVVSAITLWNLLEKESMEKQKDKEIEALEKENKNMKGELEQIKKTSKDSNDVISKVEEAEENLSRKISNLSKKETAHFNKVMEHIKEKTQEIRKAIATARGANTRTSGTIRKEIDALSTQIQTLELLAFNTEKELNEKLLTVKQGNSKTVNSMHRKLDKIKKDLKELREEFQKASNQLIEIPEAGEGDKNVNVGVNVVFPPS